MDSLRGTSGTPTDAHYRKLLSAFPNGVLVLFDADLRYHVVGPDTLLFSKREAKTMVGKTIYELFPDATAAELELELQATIDGTPRSFDMTYAEQIHHIETQPVTIDGQPFGVLTTQEVTTERETTTALAEQTRRLETVARVLSHDLRNPLNLALGHLDIIDEAVTAPHASIATIRRALLRMETIMADALVLAQETTLTDLEELDLATHVEASWQLVPTGTATLQTGGTLSVVADPGLLGNLFENLIRNAISHGGPDVTVEVGPLDGDPGFYVQDDGPGIDPPHRDAVFDAGFSTGRDEDHSGLGLTIVKEIVVAHGWDIRLTDASTGGARFEFTGLSLSE